MDEKKTIFLVSNRITHGLQVWFSNRRARLRKHSNVNGMGMASPMSLSMSAQYGASGGSSASGVPGPTVSEQYDHLVAQAQTHHQHHHQFAAAAFQPFNAQNFVNHSFHHGKLYFHLIGARS